MRGATNEVKAALRGRKRDWRFRFYLHDFFTMARTKEISDLVLPGAEINHNVFADIPRTMRFQTRGDTGIDWLTSLVAPVAELYIPTSKRWQAFPLGLFIPSSPTRQTGSTTLRDVEAYDLSLLLEDMVASDVYFIPAGRSYRDEITNLCASAGIQNLYMDPTDQTLPSSRSWPLGTTHRRIVNDLLAELNFQGIWFDNTGTARAQEYVSPTTRAPEHTYSDKTDGLLLPDTSQTLDVFRVPNQWILVASEAESEPVVVSYTNTNRASPTSVPRRGRTITEVREFTEAVNQATLQARAERIAFEASQVYESIEFETPLYPLHEHIDVIELVYHKAKLSGMYSYHEWSCKLEVGATMHHKVRRIVEV